MSGGQNEKAAVEMRGCSALVFLCILLVLVVHTGLAKTLEVPAQFSTIQAAIAVASSGDTIHIASGTYYETLHISKSITVKSTAVVVNGRVPKERLIATIRISNTSDVHIRGITVTNGYMGISIEDSANVALSNVVVSANESSGIIVRDSSVTMTGCEIASNGLIGLAARDASFVTVVNSTISRNAFAGVYVCRSNADLNDSSIEHTELFFGEGGDGIRVRNESIVTVERSKISDNIGQGISCMFHSTLSLIESSISHNQIGIDLGWAEANIQDCVISNNHGGIFVKSFCSAAIEGNTIHGNAIGGIGVDASSPLIVNNDIMQNDDTGIYLYNGSQAAVRRNEIYDNGAAGIEVDDSGPIIENNVIRDNRRSGVNFREDSRGTAIYNEIYGNESRGITVQDGSTPLILNNTILWNDSTGIWVYGGAEPVLKNNIVVLNKSYGIDTVGYEHGSDGEPNVSFNVIWRNEEGDYSGLRKPYTDISRDPRFVDLNGTNFRLLPTSPCIAAGEGGADIGAHPFEEGT